MNLEKLKLFRHYYVMVREIRSGNSKTALAKLLGNIADTAIFQFLVTDDVIASALSKHSKSSFTAFVVSSSDLADQLLQILNINT